MCSQIFEPHCMSLQQRYIKITKRECNIKLLKELDCSTVCICTHTSISPILMDSHGASLLECFGPP